MSVTFDNQKNERHLWCSFFICTYFDILIVYGVV